MTIKCVACGQTVIYAEDCLSKASQQKLLDSHKCKEVNRKEE